MPLFTPVIDVKHKPYCGPTAIAALTGVPLARIEKMLRRVRRNWSGTRRRNMPIKGTYNSEVLRVLQRLGCKFAEVKNPERSFARFCDDTRYVPSAYLLNVPGHYMVTCQGLYCDNSTLQGPKPAEDYGKRTRRIKHVWQITAPATPMYTVNDPIEPPPREHKAKPDIKTARMQRLATQIATWEAKERRAKNALKKLRPKLARYQRLGITLNGAAELTDH